jgi:ubiquinone/menaquinone biosynthesis C-methylase UbiE
MAENQNKDFIHKEFPRKFARNDFWSQIKRTVNGQPVTQKEIDLIVSQITRHLELTPNSHLLDIGCGNGALAARLFSHCARYTGVDFSSYLLGIANEYFKSGPNITYIEGDARSFAASFFPADSFDKVLMYGCMSYFNRAEFAALVLNLSERFCKVNTVFIGNIPDINCAPEFFAARNLTHYELDNPQSPIGVWWDPEALVKIGELSGFSTQWVKMPEDFYGHHYRFDVVMSRSA